MGVKTLVTTVLLVFALSAPATAASWRFDGHGWGHGVGLAQYGAMGYASKAHRNGTWILAHYYPGTTIATRPAARIRVRLAASATAQVTSATLARGADGRRVTLSAARTYGVSLWEGGPLLRIADLRTGRGLAHLQGPVRITGATPVRLLGTAENGVRDGRYRGALVLSREAASVLAVDDVDSEQYLDGVVASEMPSSWPGAALRAQAVAARSYALAGLQPAGAAFDVYADTRSQMYRGVAGETTASTTAVNATRRQALMFGGRVADALFSASSGGRTAANEEIFPSADPVPYLRAVDDPYDDLSPYHDWSVTVSAASAATRLGALVPGDLVGLAVATTTPTGRAATVRITGSLGAVDVPAGTVRTLLGLRSTWFSVSAA